MGEVFGGVGISDALCDLAGDLVGDFAEADCKAEVASCLSVTGFDPDEGLVMLALQRGAVFSVGSVRLRWILERVAESQAVVAGDSEVKR